MIVRVNLEIGRVGWVKPTDRRINTSGFTHPTKISRRISRNGTSEEHLFTSSESRP